MLDSSYQVEFIRELLSTSVTGVDFMEERWEQQSFYLT